MSEVAIYVDAAGNTWQLTEEQAKARGLKPVAAKAAKAVKAEAVADKAVKADEVENKSTTRRKK